MEGRPIATTGLLAEVVGKCAPPKERVKTLARVFQALRIEVGKAVVVVRACVHNNLSNQSRFVWAITFVT